MRSRLRHRVVGIGDGHDQEPRRPEAPLGIVGPAGRPVQVLDVSAAGLMLAAPEGDLRVMASSSQAMRVLELFELQSHEGPCLDCYASGEMALGADERSATSELEEAMHVADRLLVIEGGKPKMIGPAKDVVARLTSPAAENAA